MPHDTCSEVLRGACTLTLGGLFYYGVYLILGRE